MNAPRIKIKKKQKQKRSDWTVLFHRTKILSYPFRNQSSLCPPHSPFSPLVHHLRIHLTTLWISSLAWPRTRTRFIGVPRQKQMLQKSWSSNTTAGLSVRPLVYLSVCPHTTPWIVHPLTVEYIFSQNTPCFIPYLHFPATLVTPFLSYC